MVQDEGDRLQLGLHPSLITAWRGLAVGDSLAKGNRVIVLGQLRAALGRPRRASGGLWYQEAAG